MSPPEHNHSAETNKQTASDQASDETAKNRAIIDSAHHSLFWDAIDPKYRPLPSDGQPLSASGRYMGPQLGPPMGLPVDSALSHPLGPMESPGLMPHSIFERPKADEDLNRVVRDPTDPRYTDSMQGIPGYRPRDIYSLQRQNFADEAADHVFPGFGRLENKANGNQWRLDYLYSQRCRIKGPGLCFTLNLP